MKTAEQIVDQLLEEGDPAFDPKAFVLQKADQRDAEIDAARHAGTLNRATACELGYGDIIFHKELKNYDGTALRARVNGKCQTWKSRPEDFRLPMKHGFRDTFQITPYNANEWTLHEPPPGLTKQQLRRQKMQQSRQG